MANAQNLQPITSKKQARILGSKGGRVKSPKKVLAAKLRELRKKGISKEAAKKLTELYEHKELSWLDYTIYVESMVSQAQTIQEKKIVADLKVKAHEMRFGKNVNVKGEHAIISRIDVRDAMEDAARKAEEYLRAKGEKQ